MTLETSYTSQPAGSGSFGGASTAGKDATGDYWPLSKLRRCYTDYLFSKRQEIDEQIDSRRYYHGSQYTTEQITVLQKRKQPIMTFNRVGRKIDGVTGTIERQRQDPKAYARTPKHEEGAELATAALRYVLDEQEWKDKSPQVAMDGAIDGIGGVEIDLITGDQGDPEIGLEIVDIDSFFYDPRSYKADFSDALYMGNGKWLNESIAEELFPDADFAAMGGNEWELSSNSDREMRWFSTEGIVKRIRVVEIWYRHKGGWCWASFTGSAILKEGASPYKDEKGKSTSKYLMFSGNVDQDGDRYGFIRNMKSAQDGINAKQSKMQHILASKRIFIRRGAHPDVEKVRAEYLRSDGVIETIGPVNEDIKTDDQSFDFTGLVKMLELNLNEIENFGPTPAMLGDSKADKSGRAIALLQQAGMAQLGPYVSAYRGWKVRVYRAIWNAVQQHWKAERWIRVTDDDGLAQFIQINGLQIDPRTGQPTLVNAIGSLDVDIIMDEAPDAVTTQGQSFEVLQALGPQFIQQYPDVAIELSPLDSATKKKIRDKQQQSMQAQQPQQQLAQAEAQAKIQETQSSAYMKQSQGNLYQVEAHLAPLQALMDGQQTAAPQKPQPYEVAPALQDAQAMASIADTHAAAQHKQAQAFKATQEGMLAPHEVALDAINAEADRANSLKQAQARAKSSQG